MPRVIAITGLAGAGKSTVAGYLQSEHGFRLVKFADPLKSMLQAIGLSRDDMENPQKKGLPYKLLGNKSPRYAMQTLGTEWGRVLMHENLWAEIWKRRARELLVDGHPIVCDDCRFLNEVEVVKDLGGEIWNIRRRWAVGATMGVVAHASEAGIASRHADWTISNNTTPEELFLLLAERMERT